MGMLIPRRGRYDLVVEMSISPGCFFYDSDARRGKAGVDADNGSIHLCVGVEILGDIEVAGHFLNIVVIV